MNPSILLFGGPFLGNAGNGAQFLDSMVPIDNFLHFLGGDFASLDQTVHTLPYPLRTISDDDQFFCFVNTQCSQVANGRGDNLGASYDPS